MEQKIRGKKRLRFKYMVPNVLSKGPAAGVVGLGIFECPTPASQGGSAISPPAFIRFVSHMRRGRRCSLKAERERA